MDGAELRLQYQLGSAIRGLAPIGAMTADWWQRQFRSQQSLMASGLDGLTGDQRNYQKIPNHSLDGLKIV